MDELTGERYPFALGGPAVWDELNPRLAVAPEAWYARPLDPDNLPNTLQVLAPIVAIATFLVGLLLVRRRRARLRGFIAEVDALVNANRHDAGKGLLALGALEESFDARMRNGKLTESEYAVVSQRISGAARRLGMRRDLGLDDGMPDVDVRVRR